MTDETRKALMEVIEAELDSYCPSPFNGAFTVSLTQIIDRLLTDRAVPEPDADAVERVAKEICDWEYENDGGVEWEHQMEGWNHEEGSPGRGYYRSKARAAIAAVFEALQSDAVVAAGAKGVAKLDWATDEVGFSPLPSDVAREAITAAIAALGHGAGEEDSDHLDKQH